ANIANRLAAFHDRACLGHVESSPELPSKTATSLCIVSQPRGYEIASAELWSAPAHVQVRDDPSPLAVRPLQQIMLLYRSLRCFQTPTASSRFSWVFCCWGWEFAG